MNSLDKFIAAALFVLLVAVVGGMAYLNTL